MDVAQSFAVAPDADAGNCGNSRLIGQFVLSLHRSVSPPGWKLNRIGEWSLGRHPALPAMRLVNDAREAIGWMLGYPIDEAGTLLADEEIVPVPPRAMGSAEAFEAFVYSFGGRFAVLLVDGREPRMYLDPC
jgi:hypothetical protein